MKVYVDNYKQEIIDLYVNKNLNTVQIAKIYGCSDSAIGRLLKRNGVKCYHTPNELHLSKKQIIEICQKYKNGKTSVELGKEYKVCDRTIVKVLRNNNIDIRRGVRRSLIKNHNYFKNIDTIQKAYFLGWMISDGAIVVPKTRPDRSPIISLEIHSKDRYILELFAKELGADENVIHNFEARNHSNIRFASKEMADDLKKYGVINRKSHKTYLPHIKEELMPHLLRGIFDGDGTATIDKNQITHFAFYGSEQICLDIRNYLHKKIGLNMNKVSKTTCYHIWWGGKTPSKLFTDYIYKDCGKYFLTRKRDKFII